MAAVWREYSRHVLEAEVCWGLYAPLMRALPPSQLLSINQNDVSLLEEIDLSPA